MYYTLEEIQNTKLYEVENNTIYNRIIDALKEFFGVLTKRMMEILNNTALCNLEQYINLYGIIKII